MRGYLHVCHYSWLALVDIILTNAYVKMWHSRRQYAWVEFKCLFSTHQRLNEKRLNDRNVNVNRDWFKQWLVGFTDGSGNFHISYQGDKWGLSFKVVQSRYNIRALYYIKKELGVGKFTKDGDGKAQLFIKDRKALETIIFPIFEKYPLLTSKYFYFQKLKKALLVLKDESLSKEERNLKLTNLKDSRVNFNYVSPAWENAALPLKSVDYVNGVVSKPWLVGFIEAEGSFYLAGQSPAKDSKSIVHGFGLTQKLDEVVLQAIGLILHIPTAVKYKELHNHYILDTTNSRAIENIISYFHNTMKGVKSLEYKIWARAYSKHKGNFSRLSEIRDLIRKIKKELELPPISGG